MFSVVTISYNQSEFLARAIDSVISQRGARLQYVVCDPGSVDGSRAIIDSYGDAIAERIYERDEGPSDGLNRGFARCRGDIYAYLNSDDTYLPGAFASVARFFAAHPEVDVLTGHALVTDRHDKVLRRAWSDPYRLHMVAHRAASQLQPSTFIRAAAFRRTRGFNPKNTSCWDSELLLDLFLSGARIAVLDEFLSTYRLHSMSITNTGSKHFEVRAFLDRRFASLMGRERRNYDIVPDIVCRLWARLWDPRVLIEHVLKGPIYKRGVE